LSSANQSLIVRTFGGKFARISAVILLQQLKSRCVAGTPRWLVLVSRTWVRPASWTQFSSACSIL